MIEITPIMIKQIVLVSLIVIGVVVAYSVLVLIGAAYLHKNSKNYPEVK